MHRLRRLGIAGSAAVLLAGAVFACPTAVGARELRVAQAQANPREAAPDDDPDVVTIYRGVLGEQRVQLMLTPSTDEPGTYVGEYFVYGGGRNIQLAGEIGEESFYLEESDDGTTVSGAWEGKLVIEANHAFVVGTWKNADESQSLAFRLERVVRTRSYFKRST